MENVQQRRAKRPDGVGLGTAYKDLQERLEDIESGKEEKKSKGFKLPSSWTRKFKNQHRKSNNEALVMYFNKKNEIEVPQYMRIIGGNVIVHNNKSHLYDPKYTWHFKIKGYPIVYCVREIDSMPVVNDDYDQLKAEGRATDWNEILLKQLLEAKTAQGQKKANWMVGLVIGVIVVGGLIWWLMSG